MRGHALTVAGVAGLAAILLETGPHAGETGLAGLPGVLREASVVARGVTPAISAALMVLRQPIQAIFTVALFIGQTSRKITGVNSKLFP